MLVEAKANVQAATPQGTTVLMQSVANGSLPVVAAVIRAGDANMKCVPNQSMLSTVQNHAVELWVTLER